MLRYAITDSSYVTGDGERWAADGVDFVQLRDKTLDSYQLVTLGRQIRETLQLSTPPDRQAPKLLINGRADIAIAVRADGVHLTTQPDETTPEQVRQLFASAYVPPPLISVSAHTLREVEEARENGVDLILFAPVFEKRIGEELVNEGVGLKRLREACAIANPVRVLALGGVTQEHAAACMEVGAAGVAGIRMFV